MKAFLFVLLSCLISLSLSIKCDPYAYKGVSSLSQCKNLDKNYVDNQCCMITYIDVKGTTYKCCYEFSADKLVHYDSKYYSIIKREIHDKYYSSYPEVERIRYYECSSYYLKMSILALLLVLF